MRGLEYELIDDFCYTLIVACTLGHILCQILVAKIPKGHKGNRTPVLLMLSPKVQFLNSKQSWEFLQPKFDAECGLRYE